MLLGSKKRTRVSDEECDNNNENGEGLSDLMMKVGSGDKEKAEKVDLKKMRLDLDRDTLSRGVPSEPFNSSSESSPKTPSSHSTYADTNEYTSSYHQIHRQQQQQQHYLGDTLLSSPNIHKLHRNPIRISTRSDASSSSSTELLNPYMNINSVLYLANLTRTSHIVNELQDDLGCMEIDERVVDANHKHGTSLENVCSMDSMDNLHHQFQNDEYVNGNSSEMVSGYQSINAILREAFLRRHQHVDAQN